MCSTYIWVTLYFVAEEWITFAFLFFCWNQVHPWISCYILIHSESFWTLNTISSKIVTPFPVAVLATKMVIFL